MTKGNLKHFFAEPKTISVLHVKNTDQKNLYENSFDLVKFFVKH